VISDKVNIWREVESAKAGLVTACDPTEIARAIEVLLDYPQDGRKMGRNGRKLVKNQYSWRRVAKLLEDVYGVFLQRRAEIGDRAEAALMGYRDPIVGRVETVTRGISVSNATPSTQGLPNVDPVYTWVRLAQRVPVRIRITDVPAGVPLVSGMTATATIRGAEARESGGWLRQRFASLADSLGDIAHGTQPSPGCVNGSFLQQSSKDPPIGPS
jgi:hypothetical protein